MSVCLTEKQSIFLKAVTAHKRKTGFLPSPSEAARLYNMDPTGALQVYGALFLKGAFGDGKGLTATYARGHHRVEINEAPVKKSPRKKPATKKPDRVQKVATLLVKLLGNEKIDSKKAFDMIASLSE